MAKKITITHDYNARPLDLWHIVIDFDCLSEVMAGIISFSGLPKGVCEQGQEINVGVRLFGFLPEQAYYMQVLECNHDEMVLKSFEKGAGVKSWQHCLKINATEFGCRLTDEIVIDAGFNTWMFALWGQFLYKARHKTRLKILQNRNQLYC